MLLGKELFQLIIDLVLRIQREIKGYKQRDEHILRAMLYQVLSLLNREYQVRIGNTGIYSSASLGSTHFKHFEEQVENHYQENHSAMFYAEKICLSPNYLNELVREYSGESTKKFILRRCITEAKSYLQHSELTVTEIAYQLGYEDPSYFARSFKTFTGVTPLHYRKEKNREK